MVTAAGAGDGFCAQLAHRLRAGDAIGPSPQLRDAAARRVFDTLGALAVGRRVDGARVETPRAGTETLRRIARLCATVRCSEIDDIDPRGLVTPGAVVVTSALVLAAESGADGPALLAAVAAGYEAMVTLGEGLDGARLLARGVWPTYLLAPVGAAAVAASMWDLDESRTADALAIALARAAGVPGRPSGSATSRWWLCGRAAADGVLAAEAAAVGLAGDPGLLERGLGPDGTIAFDPRRLRPDDTTRLEVVETKPWCVARQVLPAIAAAQALRERLAGRSRAGDLLAAEPAPPVPLAAVTVAVPRAYRAMVDRPGPGDRVGSLQSAQFQVAAALAADPALHDPLRSPPVLGDAADRVMRLTSVAEAPDLTARYPAVWAARVTVRAQDGTELSELVAEVPGTRPASGWDELAAKYRRAGTDGARTNALRESCAALVSAGPDCAPSLLSTADPADDGNEHVRTAN